MNNSNSINITHLKTYPNLNTTLINKSDIPIKNKSSNYIVKSAEDQIENKLNKNFINELNLNKQILTRKNSLAPILT